MISLLSPRLAGALFVTASAVGFGALGIFGKIAFSAGASTTTVLFLRFGIAGALMALLMFRLRLPWPKGRDLWLLAGMGAIGYVGQAFCYFSSLRYASAGLTALLLYLYPALVTLVSAGLGRDRLSPLRLAAVTASFAGIVLTVAGGISGTATGIAFGAATAVIYTAYILVGESVTSRTGAIPAATVIMLAAAAVFGVAVMAGGVGYPGSMMGWLAVCGIAVISTVVPMVGFFAGMQRMGASDAATLSTLEPIVTLILAAVFLDEVLRPVQAVGAAMVIAAVIALTKSSSCDASRKQSLPAESLPNAEQGQPGAPNTNSPTEPSRR